MRFYGSRYSSADLGGMKFSAGSRLSSMEPFCGSGDDNHVLLRRQTVVPLLLLDAGACVMKGLNSMGPLLSATGLQVYSLTEIELVWGSPWSGYGGCILLLPS